MTLTAHKAIDLIDDWLAVANRRIAKVETDSSRFVRDRVQADVMPRMEAALIEYFDGLLERLFEGEDIAKADLGDLPRLPFDAKVDWYDESDRLYKAMRPTYAEMMESGRFVGEGQSAGFREAAGVGPSAIPPRLAGSLNLGDYDLSIRDQLAKRIVGVTETTRGQVRSVVAQGISRGLSTRDIARGTEDFRGIRGLVEQTYRNRARVIALTETASAYNLGQAQGYKNNGIEYVRIFDGDSCGWTSHDDADAASGSIRTITEAESYPTAHPNCQRSWAPYLGDPPVEAPQPEARPPDSPGTSTTSEFTGSLNTARADHILTSKDSLNDWAAGGRVLNVNSSLKDARTLAQTEIKTRLDGIMAEADLRLNIGPRNLAKVLDDGRFKSQFETGTSGGAYTPGGRALAEDLLFGFGDDVAAIPTTQRPIYGYLGHADDFVAGQTAEGYGSVTVRLKASVRSRTTFTADDSLAGDLVPSPVNNPSPASVYPSSSRNFIKGRASTNVDDYVRGTAADDVTYETSYFEAQYQGGVSVDDIAEVVFRRNPNKWVHEDEIAEFSRGSTTRSLEAGRREAEAAIEAANAQLKKALDARGIAWREVDFVTKP